MAALFSAHGRGGHKTGMAMEPAAQGHIGRKSSRFSSEVGEHNLCYILSQQSRSAHSPERHRIDQVYVTMDQLFKRHFGMVLDVGSQQFLSRAHFTRYKAAAGRNPTQILQSGCLLICPRTESSPRDAESVAKLIDRARPCRVQVTFLNTLLVQSPIPAYSSSVRRFMPSST